VASGVDCLIGVGELAAHSIEGARAAGLSTSSAIHFASADEAIDSLDALLANEDVVLVKGSRGMALERLVQRLRETRPVDESRTRATAAVPAHAREGVRG